MPGPEFFQTGMGRKFYEADVPRIAKGIERLAAALEKANELEEAKGAREYLRQNNDAEYEPEIDTNPMPST